MDFQTRYDFLKTSIARYDSYYHLAAVKASLLLTSNAVLLAPALGQRGRLHELLAGGGIAAGLIVASALLSLLSVGFAAAVLASTLTRRDAIHYHSLMFTESVAESTADAHERGIRRLTENRIIDDLSHLAHLLAGGITPKYRYINIALAALVAAIVLALLALAFARA